MARFKHAFNNFSFGEISPEAQGKVDSPQYKSGLSKLENMITYPTGGARRRPGTIYVEDFNQVSDVALIPFVRSQTESYAILLRESFTSNMQAFPQSNSYGDKPDTVITVGTGITVNSSCFVPFGPSDPFSGDGNDYSAIAHAQSADRIWLAHPYMIPTIISRTAENTFTVDPYDDTSLYASSTELVKGIPFRSANATAQNMHISAAAVGTARTLTCSNSSRKFFKNEYYKITDSIATLTGVAKVVSSGVGSCAADVLIAFGANVVTGVGSTTNWSRSAWGGAPGDTGTAGFPVPGYPQTVCFWNGRLLFGGSPEFPDTVWGSESLNYFRFLNQALVQWTGELQTGQAAAMSFQIASQQVNDIKWMVPGEILAVGTASDEFAITGIDGVFGPTSLQIKRQSSYGSSDCKATYGENMVIFPQRDGRTVRGFIFDQDIQSFKAISLNDHSKHFVPHRTLETNQTKGDYGSNRIRPSIAQIVYQQGPGIAWLRDNFGGFFGITINRQEEIASWHYHKLAGSSVSAFNGTRVKAMCVIPARAGNSDLLYLAVYRYVNGSKRLFVEYMPGEYLEPDLVDDGALRGDDAEAEYEYLKPVFTDASIYQRINSIDPTTPSFTVGSTSVDYATDNISTVSDLLAWNGLPLVYEVVGGGYVAPLVDGTTYYVVNRSTATIQLSTAAGGVAINLTSGSGDITLTTLPTTIWDNVDHLVGQAVKVLGDGAYIGNFTVASGGIVTVNDSVAQTVIGLPYTHILKSVRTEAGSLFGMAQGDVKRIDQVTIRFDRTAACSYGRNEDDTLIDINFRPSDLAMDDPTPMYTGDKKLEFQAGYDRECYFYLEGSDPLPCSVVGVYIRGVVYD